MNKNDQIMHDFADYGFVKIKAHPSRDPKLIAAYTRPESTTKSERAMAKDTIAAFNAGVLARSEGKPRKAPKRLSPLCVSLWLDGYDSVEAGKIGDLSITDKNNEENK